MFRRTQKSAFGRIVWKLAITADGTSAACPVAWAQNYRRYAHEIRFLVIPLATTCATCFHSCRIWCRYEEMLVYLQTK
ncbi:hypothetical protein [Bacteroides thetaiotaomicron]|uniref:hypothetical protein n=1 Tax=Bacteroides thetaiotaomicron TaxID=818 RepID=UPI001F337B4B|nr:hypothetical protein [Bacteroides thetaiotaomicron]MCE8949662.1 hypothetical protein [Bacteroides thetaiotaomicron]MCE8967205.1 hypothetical protein [Bacteroides thetaiotaomicron]